MNESKDEELMHWIKETSANAERVMAVCTETILLGMTGVLDDRKATNNKLDFTETVHLAPHVEWAKEERWVEDGKFYTSSGVSAGMDISLAMIADLFGMKKAEETAITLEYCWHKDANQDPFAKSAGLI